MISAKRGQNSTKEGYQQISAFLGQRLRKMMTNYGILGLVQPCALRLYFGAQRLFEANYKSQHFCARLLCLPRNLSLQELALEGIAL
jgi:hypothetical protein